MKKSQPYFLVLKIFIILLLCGGSVAVVQWRPLKMATVSDAVSGTTTNSNTTSREEQTIDPGRFANPSNLLVLDPYFRHHILVVEKSIHRLHLYENRDGRPSYVRSYAIATGLTAGNKRNQGDLKTPEGIYQLIDFLSEDELLQRYGNDGRQYGQGAFVTDYPNLVDRMAGKGGGGIWLHATDDESRLEKGLDSKGCVVVDNATLKELATYIQLGNTLMIIVQDLTFLHDKSWQKKREEVDGVVTAWLNAWKNENFQGYIRHYHSQYRDSTRPSFRAFADYKRAVFAMPGRPIIEANGRSVVVFGDYALVQFEQVYKSATINDSGIKSLYLKIDDDYEWKILQESWRRREDPMVPFVPSQRFFKDEK